MSNIILEINQNIATLTFDLQNEKINKHNTSIIEVKTLYGLQINQRTHLGETPIVIKTHYFFFQIIYCFL